jgi:hypothetical protein
MFFINIGDTPPDVTTPTSSPSMVLITAPVRA